MKKKIFRNMFGIALLTAILVLTASITVLYSFFNNSIKQEMVIMSGSVAAGLNRVNEKAEYLKSLKGATGDIRLTWIDPNGTVLYDSVADAFEMENHADRQEVRDALHTGQGEVTRLSSTLDEQTHYYAQKLEDGSVLRLAGTQRSILGVFMQLLTFMALLTAGILILALILANRMTKSILSPINSLNLQNPEQEQVYDELSPLLKKLKAQNSRIEAQIETIRQQHAEHESITEEMPEGLIVLDKKAAVLYVNKSAAKIIGIEDAKSYYGKNIWVLTRNLNIQNAVKSALSKNRTETSFEADTRRFSLRANPLLEDGNIKGAALMLLDISERYEAEQMRREFSSNVSHELKTPLTTIKGYAEMLENGLVKPEDVQRVYGKICQESDRLITLVNDIIQLSGLDENSIDPVFEDVRLKHTAENVIERLKTKAAGFGVSVTLDSEDVILYGVPLLVDELAYNLIDNAITYNKKDGSVKVRIFAKNDKKVLEVSDTGIGIPLKLQERVFERFFRVDKSRSKSTGGTGLGLSIVKHIAKVHQAKIELESKTGAGTTVRVLF